MIFFTVTPGFADPRDQLRRIWDLHVANPDLAGGTTIIIHPEHGPMDMQATWPDGVTGTCSLDAATPFEFLEFVDEHSMRVRDQFDEVLIVSRAYLDHLRRARRDLLREKLKLLKTPRPALVVGQEVRFRRNGAMRRGTVLEIGARVRVAAGDVSLALRPAGVFRSLGPAPRTITHASSALNLGVPRGIERRYLDAIARWSSQDNFLELNQREQMRALAGAVVVFMPWHYFGLRVDEDKPVDIGELLVRGYGVCRHLASVAAQVLNEAGFNARLVTSDTHMWVEVDGVIVDPSVETFTNLVTVANRDELRLVERPGARSFIDEHYLLPGRKEHRYSCDRILAEP